MHGHTSLVTLLTGLALLTSPPAVGLPHAQAKPPAGIAITAYTPEPERFELALDEVELEWPQVQPGAKLRPVVPVAGTSVKSRETGRAVFEVTAAQSPADLAGISRSLEGANVGAEGRFVLYEEGQPRGPATRRILTCEVALVLVDASDPSGVLAPLAARSPKPVPDVPGSFILRADDPLAALGLAEALRQTPGVQVAYNLVRRMQFTR